jgi:Cd2+/Zn2+-exporting ATPase
VDLLNDLTQIGFTEYEAKVYLTLLRDYPTTGYQVSKASGVPRSMVYETLSRLHGRGLVLETAEGRATLYRPLPPKTLLSHHVSEHERLIAGLQGGLESLYTATQDDRVWSIEGRAAVVAYASRMIREAVSDIYLVLTDRDLEALNEEIRAACDRSVNINALLTEEGDLACGRVARHPPLESELQELTGTLLVAVKQGEVLIAGTGVQQEMRSTVTRNPDLVLIACQFVWMELFTQRIYATLGADLLERLEPEDRRIFESLG